MAHSLSLCLEAAAAQAAAGHAAKARKLYEEACRMAQEANSSYDPLERACAILSYATVALQKEGAWPLLLGKAPDELLWNALELARSAGRRSRALEGQLLFARSKAIFARPGLDDASINTAVNARLEAAKVLNEAAVEAVPWPARQARALLSRLKEADASVQPLRFEELCVQLQKAGLEMNTEVQEAVEALFEQWAVLLPEGEDYGLAIPDFLEGFLKIAEQLGRKVDAQPCHAPCEGALPDGSSDLEKELVALVSHDGAGNWEKKATLLQGKGLRGPDGKKVSAPMLKALWKQLAPKLQEVIKVDGPMACGHSCSTCPTRDDCQVHGALKDIEDL